MCLGSKNFNELRILIVHNYYQDPGGEDIVFLQEQTMLAKNDTIETLTFKNRKGLKGLIQFLLYPYNFIAANKLRRAIKSFHPDLVHIHNIHYASGPILFRTAKNHGVPVVFSLHNYRLLCPSANLFFNGKVYLESIDKKFPWDAVRKRVLDNSLLKTFWTAWVYKFHKLIGTWAQVDQYLVLTAKAKSLILESNLAIRSEQITVKPNFIKTLSLSEAVKRKPYILYVGRLSVEKGVNPLVSGFSKPGMPDLKILGDGPLKKELEETAAENISFLGFQAKEKVYQYIAEATAVILPSICYEGFPIVFLEALAIKTPVILSETLIVSEWVEDGQNGFIINPYNFEDAIKRIMENNDLKEIGENGYQLYIDQFTEEEVSKQLNELYYSILKDKKASPN